MAETDCNRCGKKGPSIEERSPFVGDLKDRVQAEVCASCFHEWLDLQIKLINEYRLHMGEPEHREFLYKTARQFFGFESPPEAPPSA